MREHSIAGVAQRLIGPVIPIGESHTDIVRLDNLKELVDVTDILIDEILLAAEGENSHMYSVKEAGAFANEYLEGLHKDLQSRMRTGSSRKLNA